MQIITLDNVIFPELLDAWNDGKCVGRFWKSGKVRTVCATRQFLIVSAENENIKFAYKPTRSLEEAIAMALQLLAREEKRGHQVERQAEYVR